MAVKQTKTGARGTGASGRTGLIVKGPEAKSGVEHAAKSVPGPSVGAICMGGPSLRAFCERLGAVQPSPCWSKLTRKQRGEMAEAAFMAKAVSLGFCVSKPFGESSRYDVIVDNGTRLLRVQVKSAFYRTRGNSYKIQARGNDGRPYTASEIDFLAAWVVPVNAWYVFPAGEFQNYSQMELFPTSKWGRSKFEKFREAWQQVK